MPTLSIELEADLAEALEAERELFGFESRQGYLRWLIEHRGSIEVTSADATRNESGVDPGPGSDPGTLRARVEADSSAPDERTTADPRPESSTVTAADGTELEVRGSPRRVRQGPDSTIRPDDGRGSETDSVSDWDPDPNTDSSDGDGADDGADADTDESAASATPSLTPERVARIPEDSVLEDAGMLGTVETERLDELTRRAVATTRKRLNRDVETGLEYRSSTRLADDSVRPGSDIADLESLSVPGRAEETIERRRRAVGQALAYLRDERRARRSDFVEALYDEYPAGYETADGWWGCIKEGLKQVDAVDGGEGARVWEFRG